jgi:hypothetical protein
MSSGYDVIVIGGGSPASTEPARSQRSVCASHSSSTSWSVASAPTGRASRPRPCCARGKAVHGVNDAAATAQVDIEAALAWRDYMVRTTR